MQRYLGSSKAVEEQEEGSDALAELRLSKERAGGRGRILLRKSNLFSQDPSYHSIHTLNEFMPSGSMFVFVS